MYLFAAILLCAYAVALLPAVNKVNQPKNTFKELYTNYNYEAPIAINNAIFNKQNVSQQFQTFTNNFVSYSRTLDLDFSVLYILAMPGVIEVNNLMDTNVSVTTALQSESLNKSNRINLNRGSYVIVNMEGINYEFNISDAENYQLKALFKSKKDLITQIHMEND